ncbi:hypothetical protein HMI56_006400 [Coelomomyces lativittatus]|nr:hypothetical protein HMI56_006400 [Coelomomyces lativittatus]
MENKGNRTSQEKVQFLMMLKKSKLEVQRSILDSKVLNVMTNWWVRAVKDHDLELLSPLLETFLILPVRYEHLQSNKSLPKALNYISVKIGNKGLESAATSLLKKWKSLSPPLSDSPVESTENLGSIENISDLLLGKPLNVSTPSNAMDVDLTPQPVSRKSQITRLTKPPESASSRPSSGSSSTSTTTPTTSTTPTPTPPPTSSMATFASATTTSSSVTPTSSTISSTPSASPFSSSLLTESLGAAGLFLPTHATSLNTKKPTQVAKPFIPTSVPSPDSISSPPNTPSPMLVDEQFENETLISMEVDQSLSSKLPKGVQRKFVRKQQIGILKSSSPISSREKKKSVKWRDIEGRGDLCLIKEFHHDDVQVKVSDEPEPKVPETLENPPVMMPHKPLSLKMNWTPPNLFSVIQPRGISSFEYATLSEPLDSMPLVFSSQPMSPPPMNYETLPKLKFDSIIAPVPVESILNESIRAQVVSLVSNLPNYPTAPLLGPNPSIPLNIEALPTQVQLQWLQQFMAMASNANTVPQVYTGVLPTIPPPLPQQVQVEASSTPTSNIQTHNLDSAFRPVHQYNDITPNTLENYPKPSRSSSNSGPSVNSSNSYVQPQTSTTKPSRSSNSSKSKAMYKKHRETPYHRPPPSATSSGYPNTHYHTFRNTPVRGTVKKRGQWQVHYGASTRGQPKQTQ